MRCPYCAEEIRDEAVVCKHCHKDLFIFRPLISRIEAVESRIEQLSSATNELRSKLDNAGEVVREQPTADMLPGSSGYREYTVTQFLVNYLVAPVVLLLVAQYLFDIRLNIHLVYLRIFAVGIGFVVGYSLQYARGYRLGAAFWVGVCIACVTVSGMSLIVWSIRGGQILPANPKEWQDVFEYATSIVLATIAGNILASFLTKSVVRIDERGDVFRALTLSILGSFGETTLTQRFQRVEGLLKAVTAVVLASGALYTGIRGVIG